MKITILTQPFDDANNPVTLGDILIELLSSTTPLYNKVWIVSAFANQQAVLHLLPYLENSISQGAAIWLVVGIDHKGTSLEALKTFLELNADVKVVHNNIPGHTFHPKIYLFEADNTKAELFIGSNNLTIGGLFTNYEAAIRITFDLSQDNDEYQNIKQSLSRLFNPPDVIVQQLNGDLIENLINRGEVVSEAQRIEATKRSSIPRTATSDNEIPISLFGNENIRKPSSKTKNLSSVESRPKSIEFGDLLWEKSNLPPSDVQRQQGNVTGGLRLVQARWEVDGEVIDQTTYFRDIAFGENEWSIGKNPPKNRETAIIEFYIHILDKAYGLHKLTISHKPSGEAGQGNYTTMLHWGHLSNTIRDLNLIGKTFRLYNSRDSELYIITIE